MMMLSLAAAALAHDLHWEGKAKVHAGDQTIEIAVRTTIARDGSVRADSWPVAQGEAKGLHRMIIDATGGSMLRDGKSEPMSEEMLIEERMQFGFYRQLQDGSRWCRQHPRLRGPHVVEGLTETRFTCFRGDIVSASNSLAPGSEGSSTIDQRFTFRGWWRDRGLVFPRHMELTRGGKPYFTLDVARFDAR